MFEAEVAAVNSVGDDTPPSPESRSLQAVSRDHLAPASLIVAAMMLIGITSLTWLHVITGLSVALSVVMSVEIPLCFALVALSWYRFRRLEAAMAGWCAAEARARWLAESDPLTASLNRRSLITAADRLIAQAYAQGAIVVAMLIDLDNFKTLNDRNGHAIGDIALQECARRVRELIPAEALLARRGGDEFALMFACDPADIAHITALAEQINAAVAAPITREGFTGQVTVSLGIAHSDRVEDNDAANADRPAAPLDATTLLHRADLAMYCAKRTGRNRHVWFEPAMETESRERGELASAMRTGLAAGEFVPYYEQQIDLASGQLRGFEMLARWHSRVFGLVTPDRFIPIAEEIGLIQSLSENLISQALRDAKSWAPHLTLSVNISPIQLRDPQFAQRLLKLLVTEGFPPGRLDIEITETALHQNLGLVQALAVSLKNQGIGISLDDFGTGFSSIAQLRALPFDRIKIDRSFVSTIRNNADSAVIVRTIGALGEGLRMPITAEGIENREVLAGLCQLGNFVGQGYLFGRPQPADAVRRLLTKRHLLVDSLPGELAPLPPVSLRDEAEQALLSRRA